MIISYSIISVSVYATSSNKETNNITIDENSGMPCCNQEAFQQWYASYCATESIEENEITMMPCENPEAFQQWYTNYITKEESIEESIEIISEEEITEEEHIEELELQSEVKIVEETTTIEEENTIQLYIMHDEIDHVDVLLDPALQYYLYNQLKSRNIEWFYEIALCQLYQESHYNPMAENKNGLDKGIAQIRITYLDEFAKESGLIEYNIFNPIDSIYIYTYLMAKNLQIYDCDVNRALSRYFTGTDSYSEQYVYDVRQWLPMLRLFTE